MYVDILINSNRRSFLQKSGLFVTHTNTTTAVRLDRVRLSSAATEIIHEYQKMLFSRNRLHFGNESRELQPTKEMNDVLGSERGKKIAKCNLAKRISSQSFYAVTGYFDSPAAVNILVKSHT